MGALDINNKKLFFLIVLLLFIINRDVLGGDVFHIIFIVAVLCVSLVGGLHKSILKNISLIFLSAVIAFFVGFVRYTNFYDVFKDAFFLSQPIIAILIGGIIANKFSKETLIKAVMICAAILSIYLFFRIITDQGIERLLSPREMRDTVGGVRFPSIILFSLGFYLHKFLYNKDSLRRLDYWLFAIQLLCLYISGSRTFWVCFVIVVICVFSKWIFSNARRVIWGLLMTSLLISGILMVSPSLREIIYRSAMEMRIDEYKTTSGINNHYRGYEGYMAQKAFDKQPAINKVVGAGMGTLIDVKNKELVGLRYIPITHNGYMFILVKLGYLGLFTYILWSILTVRLFVKMPTMSEDDAVLKIWAIASVLCLMFSNAVIWGLFNTGMNIAFILIGAALVYNSKNLQAA